MRRDGVRNQVEELTVESNGNAQTFRFHLCHRPVQLADISLEQWWMRHPTVYPDRKRHAMNYDAILGYFLARCRKESADAESSNREIYLLARLAPVIRAHGSRKVLDDAILSRGPRRQGLSEAAADLEALLRSSANQTPFKEFWQKVPELIGPPAYPEDVMLCYQRMSRELLGPACDAMGHSGPKEGNDLVSACWSRWYKRLGRRSGHEVEKTVLGILSYEARAALHRCYSVVWNDLSNTLLRKYNWSAEAYTFHRFWHEALLEPMENVHFFQGHILGLHPAFGPFIMTPTGQALLVAFLKSPQEPVARERLYHGLCLAVYHYNQRREETHDRGKRSRINLSAIQSRDS